VFRKPQTVIIALAAALITCVASIPVLAQSSERKAMANNKSKTKVHHHLPPGATKTLNPQPLPPGAKQTLNPQPLPPGAKQTLNPQPLPPGPR
jgi:hypothetical protein